MCCSNRAQNTGSKGKDTRWFGDITCAAGHAANVQTPRDACIVLVCRLAGLAL